MPAERHEGLAVQSTSKSLEDNHTGEKRKSLSPPRDEQETAKKSGPSQGEASVSRKSFPLKPKYVYAVEDQQQKAQSDYQKLHEIYHYLTTSELPPWVKKATVRFNFKRRVKDFTILNGDLYLRKKHQPCRVLWEGEVFPTLQKCHEEWAHYPKDKGKFRVKVEERFFFPQLSNITAAFIAACPECQKEKAGRAERTDHREMNPAPPVSPFFRVHLDLCGYFLNAQRKKKYIAVCVDAMTKFASARVLPNKKAATAAKAFREEIILRHGCPFEIVTDRGTEFREEFESLLKAEGLKHVRIRPRNPKANGQAERFMQLLKSTLRIMCHAKPSDWERHVSAVIFQYNVSYQETIKMSPFMCLYGRLPITPAHHLFKSYRPSFGDADVSLEVQANRLRTLEHLQKQSKLLIEQAQIKEKENYARWNIKHKPRSDPIQAGDLVIVQAPGVIRGFRLHWDGPFTFDGWSGPPENRLAIIRNQSTGKVWTRPQTEILKFTSMQKFLETYILPLQEGQAEAEAEPESVHELEIPSIVPTGPDVSSRRTVSTPGGEAEDSESPNRPVRQRRKPKRFRSDDSPPLCTGRDCAAEYRGLGEPPTTDAIGKHSRKSRAIPTFSGSRSSNSDGVLEWDSTWGKAL